MKKLKAIWAKRQRPRLCKELEFRLHTVKLLEKQLSKERRIATALHIEILKRNGEG